MKSKTAAHYWHVFWKLRIMWFMHMLEYRGNFWFWGIINVLWTGVSLFFFTLLVNVQGNLAGWTIDQVYLLLGVFTIFDAFTWSIFHRNMSTYTQAVFDGSLNLLATKPIDLQFMLMIGRNDYTFVFRLAFALVLIVASLQELSLTPSGTSLLLALIALLAGMVFLYSLWFIISTFAFYVERLNNINEIIPAGRRIWQVPRGVFTTTIGPFATSVIPLLLLVSLPSELLLGQPARSEVGIIVLSAVVTLWLSRKFFYYSLRKYSGAAQ